MSPLNRRQFLIYSATTTGLAASGSIAAQDSDSASDFASSTTSIPEIMKREGVPGLQIAVIRDGEIPLFTSFGVMNAETEEPVTPDTLFEAASLTKPIFAYIVMKLAEEGVLDLDAPLADILEAPASDPPELIQQLTARLVLSHRTGFPNWYSGKSKPSLKPSQGKAFAYSGMAYVYLQRVVEKLTQKSFQTLARERIFDPLSMSSASVFPPELTSKPIAHGHTPSGKPLSSRMTESNAAGSLICNARDYAKFAALVAKPPAPSDAFLRPDTLKEMLTPYIEAGPGVQWGLGWGLQTPPNEPISYFHWGNNNNAFHCFVVINPTSGEGVVVMTNSGNGLRACAEIVPMAVAGDHPALRWNRVIGG